VAGALDGDRQRALVSCARAELAARLDLAALGKVAAHARDVLVIDFINVVGAERADLATRAETATATTATASAAARATVAATVAAAITTAVATTLSATFAAFSARTAEARGAAFALLAWRTLLRRFLILFPIAH